MPNPGQPTVGPGSTGDPVRRAQRALRRTPDPSLVVDGIFGPATEAAVKTFQQGQSLTVDGIVGPQTWQALPDGGPMPTQGYGKVAFMQPDAALACAAGRGRGGGWRRRCCRGRPGAGG